MLILAPYRVDALFDHPPIGNWVLIAVTCVISALGFLSPDSVAPLVLAQGHPVGLVGHLFLHGSVLHLAGNMLFLWVFGNVISANMNQIRYVVLYLVIGMVAGLVHIAIAGTPAVGASGAINGIIGMTVAAYPRDRVNTFWWFFIRWGTFSIRLWILVVLWLLFDISGIVSGDTDVAHWAHICGLVTGLGLGMLSLLNGWIHMTRFDRSTLLEMLGGPSVERKG